MRHGETAVVEVGVGLIGLDPEVVRYNVGRTPGDRCAARCVRRRIDRPKGKLAERRVENRREDSALSASSVRRVAAPPACSPWRQPAP